MELKQLQRIFKNLHPLASLRVTFKSGRDGIVGLRRLNAYDRQLVRIDEHDRDVVRATLAYLEWSVNSNRTIRVSFPMVDQRNEIITIAIYRDIDKVMPGSDTPLSRLLTGRKKMLDLANKDLIGEILTDNVQKMAWKWGWNVQGVRRKKMDCLNFDSPCRSVARFWLNFGLMLRRAKSCKTAMNTSFAVA